MSISAAVNDDKLLRLEYQQMGGARRFDDSSPPACRSPKTPEPLLVLAPWRRPPTTACYLSDKRPDYPEDVSLASLFLGARPAQEKAELRPRILTT